VLVKVTGKR